MCILALDIVTVLVERNAYLLTDKCDERNLKTLLALQVCLSCVRSRVDEHSCIRLGLDIQGHDFCFPILNPNLAISSRRKRN